MTTEVIPNIPLPTLDRLAATVPDDVDVKQVAKTWFDAFSSAVSAGDVQAICQLFHEESFWRDILSLTWEFRTFSGLPKITQFLTDRLPAVHPTAFKLRDDAYLGLQRPYPDIAWIRFMFDFETDTGIGSGVARLIPDASGEWKAHCIFTNLEDLKGFPERIGSLRNYASKHGKWAAQRQREIEFEDAEPTVVIIGGGQSGLELAARLKALGVPTLVVERNPRIGDNWRNRYDALCLHDPVWYDHMPYIPFPSTWPVYAPARKLANWLENYAEVLELNVWTSSTVLDATQDESTSKWSINIQRQDGTKRSFTVGHVVFATGLGSGVAELPSYPGMDTFKGQVLHSIKHKNASDYRGKKVVVVGSCSSGHDIAMDCHEHDIDVTMYQRGSTYVMSTKNGWKVLMEGTYSENAPPSDIADRLGASFPIFLRTGLSQRSTKAVAELDKEMLDGLRNVGFKLNDGVLGTGFGILAWQRAGGYYLDVGGSQLIADGKIKLKNGSLIERFTEDAIKFEDGSELAADVVVFATGLGDPRKNVGRICGDAVMEKCKPVWGLDEEGEISGVWRDFGVKGLWYMMGNLASCRFHSKHVALQIKAIEEGVFSERYSSSG